MGQQLQYLKHLSAQWEKPGSNEVIKNSQQGFCYCPNQSLEHHTRSHTHRCYSVPTTSLWSKMVLWLNLWGVTRRFQWFQQDTSLQSGLLARTLCNWTSCAAELRLCLEFDSGWSVVRYTEVACEADNAFVNGSCRNNVQWHEQRSCSQVQTSSDEKRPADVSALEPHLLACDDVQEIIVLKCMDDCYLTNSTDKISQMMT